MMVDMKAIQKTRTVVKGSHITVDLRGLLVTGKVERILFGGALEIRQDNTGNLIVANIEDIYEPQEIRIGNQVVRLGDEISDYIVTGTVIAINEKLITIKYSKRIVSTIPVDNVMLVNGTEVQR